MTFYFSPSQLSLLECPRCFWLKHHAGIERPRGIFPGIMGKIDRLIQNETTKYAGKGKPPWLLPWVKEGIIRPGSKRLKFEGYNHIITGIYDELIELKDGSVIIVDYKTAAQPHSKENTARYYQLQLDMYALLCEANGLKVADTAYIVYTTPDWVDTEIEKPQIDFGFKVTHVSVPVSARRAKGVIVGAIGICNLPQAPSAAPRCEFCKHHSLLSAKSF